MPPKRKAAAKADGTKAKSARKDEVRTSEADDGNIDQPSIASKAEVKTKVVDNNKKELKIVSFNVAGVRAWIKKDGLSFVKSYQPDMLMMQETKCSQTDMPAELKMQKGYYTYTQGTTSGNKGYAGVALLSKIKPLSVTFGLGKEEHDGEGRIITAEYEEFFLIGAYVPNSGRGLVRLPYRAKWDADLSSYLKTKDAIKPVIYCGDLNVAHEEIDLKNPKSNRNKSAGFTDQEREAFTDLLATGYKDSFRHLHPSAVEYSYWSFIGNARAKNVGWRLDYFLVADRLMENVEDSAILSDIKGSDHCPIVLMLRI